MSVARRRPALLIFGCVLLLAAASVALGRQHTAIAPSRAAAAAARSPAATAAADPPACASARTATGTPVTIA